MQTLSSSPKVALSLASLNIGTHREEPSQPSNLYHDIHPEPIEGISSSSSFEKLDPVYPTLEYSLDSQKHIIRSDNHLRSDLVFQGSHASIDRLDETEFVFEASAPPLDLFSYHPDEPIAMTTEGNRANNTSHALAAPSYQLHILHLPEPLTEENLGCVYENSELKSHVRVVQEVSEEFRCLSISVWLTNHSNRLTFSSAITPIARLRGIPFLERSRSTSWPFPSLYASRIV